MPELTKKELEQKVIRLEKKVKELEKKVDELDDEVAYDGQPIIRW